MPKKLLTEDWIISDSPTPAGNRDLPTKEEFDSVIGFDILGSHCEFCGSKIEVSRTEPYENGGISVSAGIGVGCPNENCPAKRFVTKFTID